MRYSSHQVNKSNAVVENLGPCSLSVGVLGQLFRHRHRPDTVDQIGDVVCTICSEVVNLG